MMKEALLIFAKNPIAGKVKTRLAATIGNEEALVIYQHLLLHTVSVTEDLSADKFVFYSDYLEVEDLWQNKHYHKNLQQGKDLGERMANAFDYIFLKGYRKAVIIGTDCPGLNPGILMNAFAELDTSDVVIGPAADGGYYLLGLNGQQQQLFTEMQWSTSRVLHETIKRCADSALEHYLLPVLSDIDDEKDLGTTKLPWG